ncbi:MAG: hypothetical protein MRY74_01335 [Neomegalonema sp.]|nr:hypothetical protein [Neomegalonema sp.]
MLSTFRTLCAALLIAFGVAVTAQTTASAQGHPPGSFIIRSAQKALDGDPRGVWEFVRWRETPQGHAYWLRQARAMESGGVMESRARRILRGWIRRARAGERSAVPPTFVLSAARRAARSDPSGVISFVTWARTPQGHKYWSAQHRYATNGERIYPLARRTILNWIRKAERGFTPPPPPPPRPVAGGHPPCSFKLNAAQRALDGDPRGVWDFVLWRETPQGHAYWQRQARAMEAGGVMSPRARRILRRWVRVARRGARSPVPPTFVLHEARRALRSNPSGLIRFVTWARTPQGHAYWSCLHRKAKSGTRITPLARRILRNWISKY